MAKEAEIAFSLVYEEELRGIRLSEEKLRGFLEWVIENSPSVDEFIEVGVRKTITAGIVWRIKKGLKRIVHRERNTGKGNIAALSYYMIENGAPLWEIPPVVALFLKEVKNHPLAERREVWNILYQLLPSRIEKPSGPTLFDFVEEKKEKKRKGRIILPGEEEKEEKKEGKIIMP